MCRGSDVENDNTVTDTFEKVIELRIAIVSRNHVLEYVLFAGEKPYTLASTVHIHVPR